jgi:hypothetical protein
MRKNPMSKKRTYVPALASAVLAGAMAQNVLAVQNEDMDFDTTEDLYQVCSVKDGAAEYVPASFACRAFLEATVQYHDEVSDRKNLKRLICYPSTATIADARQIFVDWAKKNGRNGKLMNEAPVVGVVRALAKRYPCK